MSEEVVENNNFDGKMTSNGIQWDDYRETYRPIDSNDVLLNVNRIRVNQSQSSGDNMSKCSSKSSIKSNGSEDRHSVKSHKSDSKRKRFLLTKDRYCWDCHKSGVDFSCNVSNCLRSYHKKCPSFKKATTEWQSCPECIGIMRAEEGTNPLGCMQLLNGNIDKMAELLSYTIITVKHADRNQSFHSAVSPDDYPDYLNLIVNPMDLNLIEENVKNKTYASTNSFLADIKWVYHNCIVFNSDGNNALISDARNILRVAKQECEEIEICPDCYLNYYTLDEDNYFSAVCERPHPVVWAKLKGHPYWPAKIVRYNQIKNEVDVRFFGTHDKCWLKPEKCLLMSKNYPNNKKPPKFDQNKFDDAIQDMDRHLTQLEKKFKGFFKYYDKHTVFTVDHLYLTTDRVQSSNQTEDKSRTNEQQMESPKKSLSYNGIQLKPLKVNITDKFDITTHIIERNDDLKSPSLKRFKRTSLKTSPSKQKPNRCFSTAIAIREELSSSIESDQSFNDSKDGSRNDRSVGSHTTHNSYDLNSINVLNGNRFDSNANETNDSTKTPKFNPKISQSKTVTVSGKSSEVKLNLNEVNNSFTNVINDESNNKQIDSNSNISLKLNEKSTEISSNDSKSLLKRIKILELKKRRLDEDLNEANNRIAALEEEKDELKKTNEELVHSICDIKKKQWCVNCSKEGILPCCWNTCYCTVDCQHEHWPTHSKSCRRKQQSTRT